MERAALITHTICKLLPLTLGQLAGFQQRLLRLDTLASRRSFHGSPDRPDLIPSTDTGGDTKQVGDVDTLIRRAVHENMGTLQLTHIMQPFMAVALAAAILAIYPA